MKSIKIPVSKLLINFSKIVKHLLIIKKIGKDDSIRLTEKLIHVCNFEPKKTVIGTTRSTQEKSIDQPSETKTPR